MNMFTSLYVILLSTLVISIQASESIETLGPQFINTYSCNYVIAKVWIGYNDEASFGFSGNSPLPTGYCISTSAVGVYDSPLYYYIGLFIYTLSSFLQISHFLYL